MSPNSHRAKGRVCPITLVRQLDVAGGDAIGGGGLDDAHGDLPCPLFGRKGGDAAHPQDHMTVDDDVRRVLGAWRCRPVGCRFVRGEGGGSKIAPDKRRF